MAPRLNRSEALVGLFAQGLLGRHVQRRAGDETGGRELHVFHDAGQAEIGQLDAALRRLEQDIAGLDVAVDQALLVRGGQPVSGLHADADDFAHAELFVARQPLFQALAGDQLHDEIGQPGVPRFFDLVDRHDVFVGNRGRGAGLAAKPLPGDFVAGQFRIEHLDGHVALQPRVEGFEHEPHPAAAQHAHHVEVSHPPQVGRIGRGLEEIQRHVALRRSRAGLPRRRHTWSVPS